MTSETYRKSIFWGVFCHQELIATQIEISRSFVYPTSTLSMKFKKFNKINILVWSGVVGMKISRTPSTRFHFKLRPPQDYSKLLQKKIFSFKFTTFN